MTDLDKVHIFRSKEEYFDYLTIIHKKTGKIYGSSDFPSASLGFGQYIGNVGEIKQNNVVYAIYYQQCKGRVPYRIMRYFIKDYLNMMKEGNIMIRGKQKLLLTDEVKQYIKQIVE
jgi:hypothetical protein